MKSIRYYVADAFTSAVFGGNPAGVCVLEAPLPEPLMQQIAAENNLSETAFVCPEGERYALRWFTPKAEIDLCGHATLATAFVLSQCVEPGKKRMDFSTKSGLLSVERHGDLLELDFPSRPLSPIPLTAAMGEMLGVPPVEAYLARDYCFVLSDEEAVRTLAPDFQKMALFKEGLGVTVTAPGVDVDFVSRFFCPELGVPEDPVTGSAHCNLIPYWAEQLQKTELSARQLSARGGELRCRLLGDRVKIAGRAVLYLKGELTV